MTLLVAGSNGISSPHPLVCKDPDDQTKEVFRPYRVFCARKEVSFVFFYMEKKKQKSGKKKKEKRGKRQVQLVLVPSLGPLFPLQNLTFLSTCIHLASQIQFTLKCPVVLL